MNRYWWVRVTITPDEPEEDRERQDARFWSTAAPYSMELLRDALAALSQEDIFDEVDPNDLCGDGDDLFHCEAFSDYQGYHWRVGPCLTDEQIEARKHEKYTPPNQTPRSLAARGVEPEPTLFEDAQ